jgi:hypothetical protein
MLEEVQKLAAQLNILMEKSTNQEDKLQALSSQLLSFNSGHQPPNLSTPKQPPVTPITLPPEARAEEES